MHCRDVLDDSHTLDELMAGIRAKSQELIEANAKAANLKCQVCGHYGHAYPTCPDVPKKAKDITQTH